jgi:signal transduction histidine kinase
MQPKRAKGLGNRTTEAKGARKTEAHRLSGTQCRLDRLNALHEITLAVTSSLDLRTVLDALLEKIDFLLPYTAATVRLLNRDSLKLEPAACRNIQEKEWKEAVPKNKVSVVAGKIQAALHPNEAEFFRKQGFVSFLEVPMIAKGEMVGVLSFHTRDQHPFTREEVEFLKTLADQAAVAIHNSRLYEQMKQRTEQLEKDMLERRLAERELERSHEQFRGLARRMQSVREEERERIAREIHDELAQSLTAMKMDLSWLKSRLYEDQGSALTKTEDMLKLVNTTMETVRRISTALRPAILDHLGLGAAIQWQANEFQTRTGIQCRLTVTPEDITLDRHRSTSIFRVFQEFLTNVALHANATEVNATLKREEDQLLLELGDNGRGITEKQIYDPKSLGLLGIRERVLLLFGEFNIRGITGEGTMITVRVPLRKTRVS